MKLVVIHGENIQASYIRLQDLLFKAKARGWNTEIIFASEIKSLAERFSNISLFKEKKFFVLKEVDKIDKSELAWLKKNWSKLNIDAIIYHEGKFSEKIIKQLPKPDKIEEYKLSTLLFKFLDSFYPGNAKNCLRLFNEAIKKDPVEIVLILLFRTLKNIYKVKLNPKTREFPFWKLQKLERQASYFERNELVELISQLADIDIKVKTSKADFKNSLDLLIIDKLE